MVYIVGMGPGSKNYMLVKAIEILNSSDMIIGFKRVMESINFIKNEKKITVKNLREILDIINDNDYKVISIAASGDPCFYGILDYVNRNYKGNISTVPGISSFQYLMTKLNKSWKGAYLGSLHGREGDLIEKVKENKISIWLTDNANSPDKMCEKLSKANISARVYIGENLSYEDERIYTGEPKEFIYKKFLDLSVVVIENEILKG